MSTATAHALDLSAFDRVTEIDNRVRLMISYLQLFKHRVVDQPLPRDTYVGLLRDAKPEQRVTLTLKLLDVQSANPRLRVEIPTELLVLAVYETTDEAQLSELTRRLPWTEAVRAAIEDVSGTELVPGRRRTIPIELRVTQRVFGDAQTSTPTPRLDVDAMLRIGKSQEVLAALGNYRRLRVAGVFRGGISSARVARILETIRDGSDRIAATDWAHRAGLLTATHFGRTVVHALSEIEDEEQLLRTQSWYLHMLRLGAVHEPMPARLVARSIAWGFSVQAFDDVHALLELLPDALIDDVSIQAALETDPRSSVRTGKTAPHAAVPGALWQSVREVA